MPYVIKLKLATEQRDHIKQKYEITMSTDMHQRNLQYSIRELNRLVTEQEKELNKLRAESLKSTQSTQSPLDTLEILSKAYENLAEAEPYLPFPESVLPALVALRKTHQTALDSRQYLSAQEPALHDVQRQLDTERINLTDHHLLTSALRERISSLQNELSNRETMASSDVADEKVTELQAKKKLYDVDTKKLLKSFNSFVDKHLGSLLAAEELGGPVVGDMMDIDEEALASGFTAKGRPRKPKNQPDADTRQRRIDEIWNTAQTLERKKSGEWNEGSAAGEALKKLTERLLNQLIKSNGTDALAYVEVDKESSAVRFLVRSKVAMFHPRDAHKLRLVDFGRDLDD